MKTYLSLIIGCIILSAGNALSPCWGAVTMQTPADVSSSRTVLTADAGQIPSPSSKQQENAADDPYGDKNSDYDDDPLEEASVTIADPIEPFNRAMHTFNDKMYFWMLKPVARGYKAAVPEPARISVKNFFSNLKFPVRLVSCLLQADFSGAATETGRFTINTIWGIGGLMDPAAGKELDLRKQDTDLGQTLGVYGVGHGFYIVWPFFGPSSPRGLVDIAGNQVLYPLSFLNIWYASVGAKAFETINSTSLRIGDYESLIGAAIDPYVSIRNAYVQYSMKEVKARKARSLLFKNAEADQPEGMPQPEQ